MAAAHLDIRPEGFRSVLSCFVPLPYWPDNLGSLLSTNVNAPTAITKAATEAPAAIQTAVVVESSDAEVEFVPGLGPLKEEPDVSA